MNFKKGDIVICVKNDAFALTVGKKYVVSHVSDKHGFVYVETDIPEKIGEFYDHRFMLLEDWRQQQLDKLI